MKRPIGIERHTSNSFIPPQPEASIVLNVALRLFLIVRRATDYSETMPAYWLHPYK